MRLEIRRLEPVRTANISAVVHGLVMAVFMLIAIPIMAIVLMLGAGDKGQALVILLVFLVYPILGLVFGWIGGLLVAVIYNLVVRFTGGLVLEGEDLSARVPPANI